VAIGPRAISPVNNKNKMSETLLEVKNLKKYFPVKRGILYRTVGYVHAVDGVDFTIDKGKTLGLVGESGSGKTTVGRMILRLLDADAGEIYFKGQNILNLNQRGMRPLRRHMQVIFQDPYGALNPRFTVEKILAEGLKNYFSKSEKKKIPQKVDELLELVELPTNIKKRYPHEFSGGQRQRIGIARALSLKPDLIICDEPVSALDVSIQAQIINLLEELQTKFNLSYLFIAHDLAVVEHVSDEVAVMYLGKIVERAPKKELYQNPLHPYTQILIKSVPIPDPTQKSKKTPIKGDIPSPLAPPPGCPFHTRCPIAEPRCKTEVPEFRELKPNHFVSCHLA